MNHPITITLAAVVVAGLIGFVGWAIGHRGAQSDKRDARIKE